MAQDRTALFAYVIIVILLTLLFFPALVWLVQSWLGDPYYSHGFLVPPIAAFLAWRQWRHLVAEPRQSQTWIGIPISVISLAIALWAMRWQNYFVGCLCLVTLLTGILLYLEGWLRVRHWLFPLIFLAIMIPLPVVDLASPWLESFTARWATALARLAGIPAGQQGGEIWLPGTAVVVGAPCSGLRSIVAMITVATLWIYLVQGRPAAKALMAAAVVPLVVASNVLRIAVLLVVAYLLGQDGAMTYYHSWSSPLLFVLALAMLLILGKLVGCWQVRDDIF